MSAATHRSPAAAHAPTERPSALMVYRDDGPLARALGGALPAGLARVPALALAVPGVVVELAAIAIGGADVSRLAAALVLAWLVLSLGASRGASHADRMAWAAPTLVRLGEYVALIWIATLDGRASQPAAFALLCALAFRHYDLVYRLRHQGTTPPGWVDALSLGWEGRVVLAFLLLVAGALPAAYFVWAALIAVVFVAEATRSWLTHSRGQRTVDYEDEEDEGQ
jgi:hypothetical protein